MATLLTPVVRQAILLLIGPWCRIAALHERKARRVPSYQLTS